MPYKRSWEALCPPLYSENVCVWLALYLWMFYTITQGSHMHLSYPLSEKISLLIQYFFFFIGFSYILFFLSWFWFFFLWICPFHLNYHIICIKLFIVFPYNSFNFSGDDVSSDVFSFLNLVISIFSFFVVFSFNLIFGQLS